MPCSMMVVGSHGPEPRTRAVRGPHGAWVGRAGDHRQGYWTASEETGDRGPGACRRGAGSIGRRRRRDRRRDAETPAPGPPRRHAGARVPRRPATPVRLGAEGRRGRVPRRGSDHHRRASRRGAGHLRERARNVRLSAVEPAVDPWPRVAVAAVEQVGAQSMEERPQVMWSRRRRPVGVAGRQSEAKATLVGRRRGASRLECSGDFHHGLRTRVGRGTATGWWTDERERTAVPACFAAVSSPRRTGWSRRHPGLAKEV